MPSKPHADFPLFPHTTVRWAKKVRGRLHYFGPWADPDGSLAKWLATKDYLLAGRAITANLDGARVRDLCNRFLTAKKRLVDTGELTHRSFVDYFATCQSVIASLGKDRLLDDLCPEDFERLRNHLAKTRRAVALGNVVQRVRSLFNYRFDDDLMEKPVKFGS